MAAADPQLEQSLVGAILSRRFRLTQELGRGGMGAVYAAVPVDGGRPLAIKILHPHFIADVQVLTRFLEEGRTCMRLVHPNILRVHECLTAEDGSPYLVMDLLEGVPLSAYTRNGGRIHMAHAVPILQGMLAGLAHAHQQGVVHRDLKPGNVFLARDEGGLFVVKLLDFGIAKVMDAAGGMGNKTRTGMLLGTPAYMSPEQIKNAKDVDARADLWSAGVMFYEMLTGRTAFPAPTEYARLSAVLQTNPEPIERVDPQLSPLAAFVVRAMQKDRERRFKTAREMALALTAASAAGEPASRVVVAPLSRLPDRPWVEPPQAAAPSAILAPPPPAPAAVAAMPVQTAAPPANARVSAHPAAPPPAVASAGPFPEDEARTRFEPAKEPAMKTPGGTLASNTPSSPPTPPATPPSAAVVVVPRSEPTAPPAEASRRPADRRGVAPAIVLVLVLGALIAGLALGFALGRTL